MEDPKFGPLQDTVAAALAEGQEIIYDERFKSTRTVPLNVTGAVPLRQWPGLTGKNGGGYEYAYTARRSGLAQRCR
jgi:hypothetical protein